MTAKSPALSLASVVMQRPEQVGASIDEVVAIMNVDKGVYYLLDGPASAIWTRIASPIQVSELCVGLSQEFDVSTADCERDVLEFLTDLIARDLAQVQA